MKSSPAIVLVVVQTDRGWLYWCIVPTCHPIPYLAFRVEGTPPAYYERWSPDLWEVFPPRSKFVEETFPFLNAQEEFRRGVHWPSFESFGLVPTNGYCPSHVVVGMNLIAIFRVVGVVSTQLSIVEVWGWLGLRFGLRSIEVHDHDALGTLAVFAVIGWEIGCLHVSLPHWIPYGLLAS